MSKKTLGRGLSSLMGNESIKSQQNSEQNTEQKIYQHSDNEKHSQTLPNSIEFISLFMIEPSPFQPRKNFEPEKLEELKNSIIQNGVVTPITVRKVKDKFQIIAGERRFRAAKQAELEKIPAYIINVTDDVSCEISIIENTQRDDLSPIEEALGYQNLIHQFNYTQDKIAQRTGKSRSHIANMLRILSLPEMVQKNIYDQNISLGHAKVLLQLNSANEIIDLANKILESKLSVRETERKIKIIKGYVDENSKKDKQAIPNQIPNLRNSNAETNNAQIHSAIRNTIGDDTQNTQIYDSAVKDTAHDAIYGDASDYEGMTVLEELQRMEEIITEKTGIKSRLQCENGKFSLTFECQDINRLEQIVKALIVSEFDTN